MKILKLLPLVCLALVTRRTESVSVTLHGQTIDLTSMLTTMAANGGTTGQLYFSKWNSGCLGHKSIDFYTYGVFPTADCFSAEQPLWHWEDSHLMLAPLGNLTQACLDDSDSSKDGLALVYGCSTNPNQNFTMQVHPNQVDFEHRRLYFSIHSQLYPTRCLTVSPDTSNFSHDFNRTFTFDAFTLQECTGRDAQSFYLETKWFAELDKYR